MEECSALKEKIGELIKLDHLKNSSTGCSCTGPREETNPNLVGEEVENMHEEDTFDRFDPSTCAKHVTYNLHNRL